MDNDLYDFIENASGKYRFKIRVNDILIRSRPNEDYDLVSRVLNKLANGQCSTETANELSATTTAMSMMDLPSQSFLRHILDYIPTTGELIWKKRADRSLSWNRRWAGRRAGSGNRGAYRMIDINSQHYQEHRIIYQLAYGSIPDGMMIDHANRVKTDNRLENLRIAAASQNQINRYADSGRSLPKNIYGNRHGKYRLEMNLSGVHVGSESLVRDKLAELINTRDTIEKMVHGQFARCFGNA